MNNTAGSVYRMTRWLWLVHCVQ